MRTTRLGISTFCYPYAVGVPGFAPQRPMTACELVDRAADLHVPVLQIGDNLPLHLLPEDALERLSRRAAEREITLEIGTRGIWPEHLLRYLAIADSLHAKLVRVVIDTPQDRPDGDILPDPFVRLRLDGRRCPRLLRPRAECGCPSGR